MYERILKILVPATTSNLGNGFDVLGMCLDLYNEYELTEGSGDYVITGKYSSVYKKNLVGMAFSMALKMIGHGEIDPEKYNIYFNANIPSCGGLGASSTANIAGVYFAFYVAKKELDIDEIAKIVCILEGHPDNALPALYGNAQVCYTKENNFEHITIPISGDIKAVIFCPDYLVDTNIARSLLPRTYPKSDIVKTAINVGVTVAALSLKNFSLLKYGMEDVIHQPYRQKLIGGFYDIINSAMRHGAYASYLSGSGATMIALTPTAQAAKLQDAVCQIYKDYDTKVDAYILDLNTQGVIVEEA